MALAMSGLSFSPSSLAREAHEDGELNALVAQLRKVEATSANAGSSRAMRQSKIQAKVEETTRKLAQDKCDCELVAAEIQALQENISAQKKLKKMKTKKEKAERDERVLESKKRKDAHRERGERGDRKRGDRSNRGRGDQKNKNTAGDASSSRGEGRRERATPGGVKGRHVQFEKPVAVAQRVLQNATHLLQGVPHFERGEGENRRSRGGVSHGRRRRRRRSNMLKEESAFDRLLGNSGGVVVGGGADAGVGKAAAAANDASADDSFDYAARRKVKKKRKSKPSLSEFALPAPPAPSQESDPFAFSCAESEDDSSFGSAMKGHHHILKTARLKKKRLKNHQRSGAASERPLNERHLNISGDKYVKRKTSKKKRRHNA